MGHPPEDTPHWAAGSLPAEPPVFRVSLCSLMFLLSVFEIDVGRQSLYTYIVNEYVH